MIQITGVKRQVIISGCIYIGQMLVGFTNMYTGPIIPKLRDPEQSPLSHTLTETEISLIGSLLYVGALPGSYTMGWLSNVKGRKLCIFIGGVFGILAYLILATTKNLAMLYCGRLFAGTFNGIISILNIVYIGEIASTNIRGILLTVLGIFTTCGAAMIYAVGPFFSYSVTSYVGLIIALIFTCSTIILPDTPQFYALKGEEKNFKKILKKLGRLEDLDKIGDINKEIKQKSLTNVWSDLFKLRSNRRALVIVVTVNILQHCSGILAVGFFSASIFELAGSSIDYNLAMIVIVCFQLCGSSVTPFLVERNGRKTLLMVSSALCSLSMFIFGIYFYLEHIGYSGINTIKWLPLVILITYFTSYEIGLGIIPNAIIGEMFTINVRSTGSTVAMTTSWLAGFIVTTVFGTVVENFGPYVIFWFFSCTCACAFVFGMFCIPETKGKSLLEIQEFLGK